MATTLPQLVRYLEETLVPAQFRDYVPNGLQIEGRQEIRKLVSGVSANQALIDGAVEANADALLVHHGYFWDNEDRRLIGIRAHRIKTLFNNDMSLLAYHLPLDSHSVFGNNAQLARVLSLEVKMCMAVPVGMQGSICQGTLAMPMTGAALAQHIAKSLGRTPLHIAVDPNKMVNRVAWCTGAAIEFLPLAIKEGADAYITGEFPERAVDLAKENNIQLFGAGHHATERYGVEALGQHLAEKFNIEHEFIDIDSPL